MPAQSGNKRRSHGRTVKSGAKRQPSHAKSTPSKKVVARRTAVQKGTEISFRPRIPEDDAFIVQLTENQLGTVHQNSFGEPFPRQDFERYLQSGAPTIVVMQGTQTIGYYSYLVGPDGKMHVSALVIDPLKQSDGVGTQVMNKLEADARAHGVHVLEVFVQDVNTKSMDFTKKLGFVEVYRIPPNTICFQKALAVTPGTAAGASISPGMPSQAPAAQGLPQPW